MAISTVVKNFRDGTIVINDGTSPTPLTLTVQFETGDFSISGLNQGNYEITKYLDRGDLGSIRKTNRSFPTGSFTAHMTDLSDNTDRLLWDAVNKTGAWASAVSTLGSTADVFALQLVLTVEGSNFGDATDHVLTLNNCHCSISFAEGDPNSFTLDFEVLGAITAT